MREIIQAKVCPVRYCGRLVCAALPLTVLPPFQFDTRKYCSPRCAEMHPRGENRTPSGPLITCDVCCEDKPLTDYIHKIREHGVVSDTWNHSVPPGCLPHLAPELLNMEGGTCRDCLRSHIATQLETRGAINISCVQAHQTPPAALRFIGAEQQRLAKSQEWLPYAHHFLSPGLRDMLHQQLFDHYIHTTTATIWTCPSSCGYGNGILQPSDTPGFPHVECPGCHGQFCANCKVPWHDKQTCQMYRALHPELHDKGEVKQLHEMARLGARRCPRCQFIIVKEGGCDHIHCEQCRFDFLWPEAERVIASPPAHVPAPTDSDAADSFRGWGQLLQAQEEYITRNRIVDTPFNIGSTTPLGEEGIYYYDLDTTFWSPDVCELDNIAGQTAGRRYVRQPTRDRNGLMAFVAVEGGKQGGATLYEAFMLELRSLTDEPIGTRTIRVDLDAALFDQHMIAPIGNPPIRLTNPDGDMLGQMEGAEAIDRQLVNMWNQQLEQMDRWDNRADDAGWGQPNHHFVEDDVMEPHGQQGPTVLTGPPFDMDVQGGHADDTNPPAPEFPAIEQFTRHVETQAGRSDDEDNVDEEAAEGGDADGESANDNGGQEEGINDQPANDTSIPPWGPPRDATDALIDQILFGAMQGDAGGRVVFGFGLGLPPMHLFEGGDEDDGGEVDPDRDSGSK